MARPATSSPDGAIDDTTSNTTAITVATTLPDIDPDVVRTHILSRLDGATLAALSCVSTDLHQLAARQDLWSNIISTAWPSTNDPGLLCLIQSFTNGPFSFFSQAFPLLHPRNNNNNNSTNNNIVQDDQAGSSNVSKMERLILAVDISYQGKNIFAKVHKIETAAGWFRSSPFRIDLLDPKESVPTTPTRKNAADEETCKDLYGQMTLSWIMIDPVGKQAVNLSSFQPVSVQRRWWSGEVVVLFVGILVRENDEQVICCIEVTCAGGGSAAGEEGAAAAAGDGDDQREELELHVRELSMWVEDIMGAHLKGEESLVIFEKGFRGKRVKRGRRMEEEVKRRYEELLEMRRERKLRKLRKEGRKDLLCVSFGVSIFIALFMLLAWTRS